MLASLHSLVICVLSIEDFLGLLAEATLTLHIHYNDLIIITSLMEAFFALQEGEANLLFCCRQEVITVKAKFKYVLQKLLKNMY